MTKIGELFLVSDFAPRSVITGDEVSPDDPEVEIWSPATLPCKALTGLMVLVRASSSPLTGEVA